ncbi:MAG: DNA gyrase subunit A [Chitinophagales bacterium]|nr:DNA gyrase subunit A [Chitinophagales bacterium]MCZ2393479.1 DNA gyrase subunit A [Chitinophagales bacterium]
MAEEESLTPRIIPINIEEEMKTAYIDYSMSVIVSRALPDVRDGLKPVHRRVLYGMQDLGVYSNRPYKKSARIVGEVLGKYHPHGDSSVYDTMVRMAQEWSLRYMLVDGQGNFGSVDGDSPAAMRYTEARLRKIAEEMLGDLDKETVDFQLNFDDSLQEPTVLPSKVPQLLVNGASGIAVGMATNIMPHNLSEVCDGIIAYIDNNDISIDELMHFVQAPDFPTGGTIYGLEGVKEGFRTGRGKVKVRAKAIIEEDKHGRTQIIVSEIPYQVNKANLISKTAELINDKKIEGIADIRDESDREGMRIVYDLKRDAIPNVVLNNLYLYTQLQTSYGINNIALVNGRPEVLNLKDMILHFVEFRHEVVVRRTKYELAQAEKRAHILEGLLIALDNIDEVIELIKKSSNGDAAREGLMTRFGLSEIQARAILDMRLQRLTGLEQDKIREEYKEIQATIERLNEILANKHLRMEIIKEETLDIKSKYGDNRRTDIIPFGDNISMEDLIANEEVVVTISHLGYIKRTNLEEYKVQGRGGKGSFGGKTRDADFIEHLFIASTHNYLLLFTEQGKCYWLKVYEIPEGNKTSKGRPIQNLLNLPQGDKVKAYIKITDLKDEEFLDTHFVVMVTTGGTVKKTSVREYSRPRSNGVNAISVREGDELLAAELTNGQCEIILGSSYGYAVRFNEEDARPIGRTGMGVKGITLRGDDDKVIGMVVVDKTSENRPEIMVVSENGFGKRTYLDDPETGEPVYRITSRGGKGVITLNTTDKTGKLISISSVTDDDDLMIINRSGITIRISLLELRVMGRNTQGVKLINLKNDDIIAAVSKVERTQDEETDANENEETDTADNGNSNTES